MKQIYLIVITSIVVSSLWALSLIVEKTDNINYMRENERLSCQLEELIHSNHYLTEQLENKDKRIIELTRYKKEYGYLTGEYDVEELVYEVSNNHNVDPKLILAMIRVESTNRHWVKSHKGAAGLMQLMPQTANTFGVTDLYHPKQNVQGGVRYVRYLLSYYEGNVDLVLAAYNAGESAVERYRGIPPYRETKNYIKKIRKTYHKRLIEFDKISKRSSRIIKLARNNGN